MCAFFESVLCADFLVVFCAVSRRWLAASRLAARFARVSRFARLFVTLTSVRGGMSLCSVRTVSFAFYRLFCLGLILRASCGASML